MAGSGSIVEEDTGSVGGFGPEFEVCSAAALAPDGPERIQPCLLDDEGAGSRADVDLDQLQRRQVTRVTADGDAHVVIADRSNGVSAGLKIEDPSDRRGNIVRRAEGSWNARDVVIGIALEAGEEPSFEGILLEVHQGSLEDSAGGAAEVGDVVAGLSRQHRFGNGITGGSGQSLHLIHLQAEPVAGQIHRVGRHRRRGRQHRGRDHRESITERLAGVGQDDLVCGSGFEKAGRIIGQRGGRSDRLPGGLHRTAIERHRGCPSTQALDGDHYGRVGGCILHQRQDRRQIGAGDRSGGDGEVIHPEVVAVGRRDLLGAGAERKATRDRQIPDGNVIIDFLAVVGHVERSILLQLDLDGNEVVAGAESVEPLVGHRLAALADDDAGGGSWVIALRYRGGAGETVDRVKGNHQAQRGATGFPERHIVRIIVGQHEAEALGGTFGSSSDADFEGGGECGHPVGLDLREDVGRLDGESGDTVSEVLQVNELQVAVFHQNRARIVLQRDSARVRGEVAAEGTTEHGATDRQGGGCGPAARADGPPTEAPGGRDYVGFHVARES